MVYFFLLYLFSENMTPKLEIFTPISSDFAALSDQGDLYISDLENSRLIHFIQGAKPTQIGRKGQGPGEYEHPGAISIINDMLILAHGQFRSIYSLKGSFERRVMLPSPMMNFRKVIDGWVGHDYLVVTDGDKEVFWFSEDLSEKKLLTVIPDDGINKYAAIGQKKQPYSPIQTSPEVIIDKTGKFAFIQDPSSFSIEVISIEKRKVLRKITRDHKRIPLNRDWADIGFEQLKRQMARFPTEYFRDYPDFFPAIKSIGIDPQNHLAVATWALDPMNPKIEAFDFEGVKTQTMFSSEEHFKRIIGVFRGFAYICVFPDGEASIVKVPLDQVDTFLKENPIIFDIYEYLNSKD